MSIKDRFPFNKLKKKNLPPATCVYAGPEQMRRRAKWDDEPAPGISEVYAGPEDMPNLEPDGSEPEDFTFEEEQAKEIPAPMQKVYAGPRPPEPMKPVYAGPEFTAPPATPQGPPPPMMCVYAGPDYFNGGQARPVGAFAPQQDPNARYCPNCGKKMPDTVKFCTECGTPLPQKETAE